MERDLISCLLPLPSQTPPLQATLITAPSPHPIWVHAVAAQYPSWWEDAEPSLSGEWGPQHPITHLVGWALAETPDTHPSPILLSPPLPRLRGYILSFLDTL